MDEKDFETLTDLLQNVKLRVNLQRGNISGRGYSQLVGYNRRKNYALSSFARKHPDIFAELQRIAEKYCPFPVKNFMLNKNYQTQPHIDKQNKGACCIYAFGNYKGGDLVIEGKVVPTHHQVAVFEGHRQEHYNLPITEGIRYSVVCFNNQS